MVTQSHPPRCSDHAPSLHQTSQNRLKAPPCCSTHKTLHDELPRIPRRNLVRKPTRRHTKRRIFQGRQPPRGIVATSCMSPKYHVSSRVNWISRHTRRRIFLSRSRIERIDPGRVRIRAQCCIHPLTNKGQGRAWSQAVTSHRVRARLSLSRTKPKM